MQKDDRSENQISRTGELNAMDVGEVVTTKKKVEWRFTVDKILHLVRTRRVVGSVRMIALTEVGYWESAGR